MLALILLCCFCADAGAQEEPSVARRWNDVYLDAIRLDFARPVVHARNLYHSSAAMYDCWALLHGAGGTSLVSRPPGFTLPRNPELAADTAVSYAAYRLLLHRYRLAPGRDRIVRMADSLMNVLGYDTGYTATGVANGGAAALGNYVAEAVIDYGRADGSNEALDYENVDYPDPVNPPLEIDRPFSLFGIRDVNRWQQLAFPGTVIDQSGNPISSIPTFLGASWGRVTPFAIPEEARTSSTEEHPILGGNPVYHDPGPPPYWQLEDTSELNFFRWNMELVLKWSGHLDPSDGVMWNISPGARGNRVSALPDSPAEYRAFYREDEGGRAGDGWPVNPVTGEPYADNIVPRGDYTRVLAEFWADGPASETPPGHWFAIFNRVMDHPLFARRLWGEGQELPALEYDVKAYLTLGGALHDAAVTAWSIKGKYDYVRPITAIRYLSLGRVDEDGTFGPDPLGIRPDPPLIEVFEEGDTVFRSSGFTVLRAWAWLGNAAIDSAATDRAGVGWIDPVVWEPYQRPNFVTPNFAGYISGHSTFSSTAATVLERLTGTPYFPGGLGEFVAKRNEFLVFEEGPSQDIVLQWATYHDAAAETSLSRIWGGIHPPVDDIPGRIIGPRVAEDAVERARGIFRGEITSLKPNRPPTSALRIFPNPIRAGRTITFQLTDSRDRTLNVFTALGQRVASLRTRQSVAQWNSGDLPGGIYFIRSSDGKLAVTLRIE